MLGDRIGDAEIVPIDSKCIDVGVDEIEKNIYV